MRPTFEAMVAEASLEGSNAASARVRVALLACHGDAAVKLPSGNLMLASRVLSFAILAFGACCRRLAPVASSFASFSKAVGDSLAVGPSCLGPSCAGA